MKTLTTQQIEELKKLDWVETLNGENNSYFMSLNLADQDFLDLTGVDLKELYDNIYLPVSNRIEYYKSSVYKNGEKFFLQYIIFIDGVEWSRSNFAMFVGDILELYTPKEEPKAEPKEEKTGADWHDLLTNALKNALEETDTDSIVEFIDTNFADVSNKIRENLCENLEVNDIGECRRQDIAEEWIENNPDDAWDMAEKNLYSDDIRDKIISYLENNL